MKGTVTDFCTTGTVKPVFFWISTSPPGLITPPMSPANLPALIAAGASALVTRSLLTVAGLIPLAGQLDRRLEFRGFVGVDDLQILVIVAHHRLHILRDDRVEAEGLDHPDAARRAIGLDDREHVGLALLDGGQEGFEVLVLVDLGRVEAVFVGDVLAEPEAERFDPDLLVRHGVDLAADLGHVPGGRGHVLEQRGRVLLEQVVHRQQAAVDDELAEGRGHPRRHPDDVTGLAGGHHQVHLLGEREHPRTGRAARRC